jgi:hypothetical protein
MDLRIGIGRLLEKRWTICSTEYVRAFFLAVSSRLGAPKNLPPPNPLLEQSTALLAAEEIWNPFSAARAGDRVYGYLDDGQHLPAARAPFCVVGGFRINPARARGRGLALLRWGRPVSIGRAFGRCSCETRSNA